MEELKEIRAGSKHMNSMYIYCFLTFALGLLGLSVGGGLFIGIGILAVVATIWHKNTPIIKILDSNIEAKLAPIASKHFIKYNSISSVQQEKRKVFIHYNNGVKDKKLTIPVRLIDEDVLKRFLETLNERRRSVA